MKAAGWEESALAFGRNRRDRRHFLKEGSGEGILAVVEMVGSQSVGGCGTVTAVWIAVEDDLEIAFGIVDKSVVWQQQQQRPSRNSSREAITVLLTKYWTMIRALLAVAVEVRTKVKTKAVETELQWIDIFAPSSAAKSPWNPLDRLKDVPAIKRAWICQLQKRSCQKRRSSESARRRRAVPRRCM